MANEITAEMLAREMCRMNGEDPDALEASSTTTGTDLRMVPNWWAWDSIAEAHLLATRALASLQAERVRCWMSSEGLITDDIDIASKWKMDGYTVTEGYFTTKGSTE